MVHPTSAQVEILSGERFQFGENWSAFLRVIDEQRIHAAQASLAQMLETDTLLGKRFLDVGSGSGLFSLAARRLGARVHSFDYDGQSVACTAELKRRYFDGDGEWIVQEGSVLDEAFLRGLGTFDIVYSWGVLHHTGAMWRAMENVAPLVGEGGKLFISIYNDQGPASRRWAFVKRVYCKSGPAVRWGVLGGVVALWGSRALARRVFRLRRGVATPREQGAARTRGMSRYYDLKDWVGGYPFEVATPEAVFDFYRERGFALLRIMTDGGGHGCNQYVFQKIPAARRESADPPSPGRQRVQPQTRVNDIVTSRDAQRATAPNDG
jgi:SAM-dependent methyltransferase